MRLPRDTPVNSSVAVDPENSVADGNSSSTFSPLLQTLFQGVINITLGHSPDNLTFGADQETSLWNVTERDSFPYSTVRGGREKEGGGGEGTTIMYLPTTEAVTEDYTTAETVVDGLLSIHIYFIIVGVLFGMVLIMLGLHNYIEIMTDGGKKSLPAFGVNTGEKSKPRATLRPVVSSKAKTAGKATGSAKGKGKK